MSEWIPEKTHIDLITRRPTQYCSYCEMETDMCVLGPPIGKSLWGDFDPQMFHGPFSQTAWRWIFIQFLKLIDVGIDRELPPTKDFIGSPLHTYALQVITSGHPGPFGGISLKDFHRFLGQRVNFYNNFRGPYPQLWEREMVDDILTIIMNGWAWQIRYVCPYNLTLSSNLLGARMRVRDIVNLVGNDVFDQSAFHRIPEEGWNFSVSWSATSQQWPEDTYEGSVNFYTLPGSKDPYELYHLKQNINIRMDMYFNGKTRLNWAPGFGNTVLSDSYAHSIGSSSQGTLAANSVGGSAIGVTALTKDHLKWPADPLYPRPKDWHQDDPIPIRWHSSERILEEHGYTLVRT